MRSEVALGMMVVVVVVEGRWMVLERRLNRIEPWTMTMVARIESGKRDREREREREEEGQSLEGLLAFLVKINS